MSQLSSAELKVGTFGGCCLSMLVALPLERLAETALLATVGAVTSVLVSRLMQRIFKKKQ